MRTQLVQLICKGYMRCLKWAAHIIPMPRPTLFLGDDASKEMTKTIGLFGIERILLVTDQGLVKLGMVSQLEQTLEQAGVQVVCYDQVLPDPDYDQVEAGVALYQSGQCQAVLALGGGSPMDCAKVIAARATNHKSIARLTGLFRVWRTPAPLFAIPTTAGTGSEATVAAVVSEPGTHKKTPLIDPKLVPLMTALEPGLMQGLPPRITAATGMDALTHALEAFISVNATPQTDGYALAAVRLIHANLETAVNQGSDLQARHDMALAAHYAGLAFSKASLGYVHAIAHNLGASYGIPHGEANAMALPHILEFSMPQAQARLAQLGRAIGLPGESDSQLAQAYLDEVRRLLESLPLPREVEALESGQIPELATRVRREAHWNYPVPRYMNRQQCEQILAQLAA